MVKKHYRHPYYLAVAVGAFSIALLGVIIAAKDNLLLLIPGIIVVFLLVFVAYFYFENKELKEELEETNKSCWEDKQALEHKIRKSRGELNVARRCTDRYTDIGHLMLRRITIQKILEAFKDHDKISKEEYTETIRITGVKIGQHFAEHSLKHVLDKENISNDVEKLYKWIEIDSNTGMGNFTFDDEFIERIKKRAKIIQGNIYLEYSFLTRDIIKPSEEKACVFIGGYLEGVISEILKRYITVSETECSVEDKGQQRCIFEIKKKREKKIKEWGCFVAHDNGIVSDSKNNLEWFPGPNKDTTWYEANSWVETLSVDGGGWRLPSIEELKSLEEKKSDNHNIIPLLKTGGWWVWSIKTKKSSGRYYSFGQGKEGCAKCDNSGSDRVFAVRSKKK